MKSKIAILMTAYKNESQLNRLINHLSKDFDIYLHIDKRSKIAPPPPYENVFVYRKYKSYWGSFNQVMSTLFLFEQAYKAKYDRYIFISGDDLPIKTNKHIIDFFTDNNNEYFMSVKLPAPGWDMRILERVCKYWPNVTRKNHRGAIFKLTKYFFKIFFKRRPVDYDFYGGSDWFQFTHGCVGKMLDYLKKDDKYIKRYRWTLLTCEIFYQTILHQIEGLSIVNDNLRYIDWETGPEGPRILRKEDYDKLVTSPALFARRFEINIDSEIIDRVYNTLV